MKVKTALLTSIVKLLGPTGNDHLFRFNNGGVSVNSVDSSNVFFVSLKAPMPLDNDLNVGIELNKLDERVPKDIEEVELDIQEREIKVDSPGWKSSLNTLPDVSCQKDPFAGKPSPDYSTLPKFNVSPQEFYDRINKLHKAFPDESKFYMNYSPAKPYQVFLSASDQGSNPIETVLVVKDNYPTVIKQLYSPDLFLEVLQPVRLHAATVDIQFQRDSSEPTPIIISGETALGVRFLYLIAPRVENE